MKTSAKTNLLGVRPETEHGWSTIFDDRCEFTLRVTDTARAIATFGTPLPRSGSDAYPRKKWFGGAKAPAGAEGHRFMLRMEALIGLREALAKTSS